MKSYYVYIASNRYRTVFYTGVTNDLARRAAEHASGQGGRFAAQYRVREIVYYETYRQITDAVAREKEIKGWRRQKKLDLIRTLNPAMMNLTQDF